ncbi:transcriptional repressor NF-X1 homolog [Topomyia yanbarensis]|uniref:transcriptional repressor NF-X1 homolog n=1 Tax=Topomyia yanbarensis TaxID=2498891 RepID=UPI00273B929E|nr:transcriptional repressor NF-X1 homolog [Topomyia yanbarensis]
MASAGEGSSSYNWNPAGNIAFESFLSQLAQVSIHAPHNSGNESRSVGIVSGAVRRQYNRQNWNNNQRRNRNGFRNGSNQERNDPPLERNNRTLQHQHPQQNLRFTSQASNQGTSNQGTSNRHGSEGIVSGAVRKKQNNNRRNNRNRAQYGFLTIPKRERNDTGGETNVSSMQGLSQHQQHPQQNFSSQMTTQTPIQRTSNEGNSNSYGNEYHNEGMTLGPVPRKRNNRKNNRNRRQNGFNRNRGQNDAGQESIVDRNIDAPNNNPRDTQISHHTIPQNVTSQLTTQALTQETSHGSATHSHESGEIATGAVKKKTNNNQRNNQGNALHNAGDENNVIDTSQQQKNGRDTQGNNAREKKKKQMQNKSKLNRARRKKQAEMITSKCSQREKLIRELNSSKLECLICCDLVHPNQPIWSCPKCYHILHLQCNTEWASSSVSYAGWHCAACRNISRIIPREYYCFCGKKQNPQFNRNFVAHSCGELCNRKMPCGHVCTSKCHPGPCTPCHEIVLSQCGCGKDTFLMECNQTLDFSCQAICDKFLDCGDHTCQQVCHGGACQRCKVTVKRLCNCSKKLVSVVCGNWRSYLGGYRCETACGALLSCGRHKCAEVCHLGPCGECAPALRCFCGKMNLSCINTRVYLEGYSCGAVCDRLLSCGRHKCAKFCHRVPCGKCYWICEVTSIDGLRNMFT